MLYPRYSTYCTVLYESVAVKPASRAQQRRGGGQTRAALHGLCCRGRGAGGQTRAALHGLQALALLQPELAREGDLDCSARASIDSQLL